MDHRQVENKYKNNIDRNETYNIAKEKKTNEDRNS